MAHLRPPIDASPDYDAIFASSFKQPEHRLMHAVLDHAIRAAQNDAEGSRALRERHEAIAWIAEEDRSGVFSFENVCEALALNARRLRAKLLATVPTPEHEQRRRAVEVHASRCTPLFMEREKHPLHDHREFPRRRSASRVPALP